MKKDEDAFSRWEVNEKGYIVNEQPKTMDEVYKWVCEELRKRDPEPNEYRRYGIIDEYFSAFYEHTERKLWPLDHAWLAVFAVTGGSEGHYIHVEAIWRDDNRRELLFLGKTFQGMDHALEIVKVLCKILEV